MIPLSVVTSALLRRVRASPGGVPPIVGRDDRPIRVVGPDVAAPIVARTGLPPSQHLRRQTLREARLLQGFPGSTSSPRDPAVVTAARDRRSPDRGGVSR